MFSQSYLFSLSGSLARWHVCTVDSVYSCSRPPSLPLSLSLSLSLALFLCLFLSRTHIFSCDSFFQFSLVLLLPSLFLPFFSPPFFPSLCFSLSPAPLLSPSERLRIPKGADAIKMLILSVYRERERGGLTAWGIAAHMENSTEMENRGRGALGEVGGGVLKGRGGRGCVLGETEWKAGC